MRSSPEMVQAKSEKTYKSQGWIWIHLEKQKSKKLEKERVKFSVQWAFVARPSESNHYSKILLPDFRIDDFEELRFGQI